MNADQLVSLYERVAEAPDAIAHLRRFVLDLAVRGKLVNQDPTNGTGDDLLRELAKAREGARNGGLGRRSGVGGKVTDGETYLDLPASWAWARVCQVGITQTGTSPSSANPELFGNFVPFVKPADLNGNQINYEGPGLSKEGMNHSRVAPKNTVLMVCIGATLGKVNITNRTICFNQQINSVTPYLEGVHRFLALALKTSGFQQLAWSKAGTGTLPIISKGKWEVLPIPVPPLSEQHRIVEKVDELMALCDQLEAARTAREATRDRLTTASLSRLTAPDTDAETFRSHARFALDALPALTTRLDQIKTLRETILSLAMCGKLVPQDAGDEPASELLKQIQLARKYKRKFAQIDENELEKPLPDLPVTWTWTTVDQISDDDENAITDGPFGSQLKTEHYISQPGFRVIRLQNIGNGVFREEHRSYVDQPRFDRLSKHHVEGGDLVVAGLVDPRVRCCEVPTDIGPALVKADCYRFAVHTRLSSRFALHFLNSTLAQELASVHHHGMTLTRIGLGNFRRIPIPLPPLAEQHRIVVKVDALMALCDQLAASLTTADTTRRRLLEALLHEALEPAADALEAAE